MKRLIFAAVCGCLAACATAPETVQDSTTPPGVPNLPVGATVTNTFGSRLDSWAKPMTIDGMSYVVVKDGKVLETAWVQQVGGRDLDPDDPLRIASVTKSFTALALLQASEEDRIDLDAAALTYLPGSDLPPEITVRHLAAHVSEGTPGADYVYNTNRYALLAEVLEAAYPGETFEQVLRKRIFKPAKMKWHDSPYLGAHAGLVSTVDEMGKYLTAIQMRDIVSEDALAELSRPYALADGKPGPASLGWFTQEIGGETVLWSFGQDNPDHSSALLLYLPDRQLGLFLLANTDELSNPYRLLMGDVRYSYPAQQFLAAYAPDLHAAIPEDILLTTHILTARWAGDRDTAFARFDTLMEDHPGAFTDPDRLVLHYAATIFGPPDSLLVNDFDKQVIAAHPDNRWALLFSAEYHENSGHTALAIARYEHILALPNQQEDFLRKLFQAWSCTGLVRLYRDDDPALALSYAEQGIALGVGGEEQADLEALKAELED